MKAIFNRWKWALICSGLSLVAGCTEPAPLPAAPDGEFTYGGPANEVAGGLMALPNDEGILIVGGSQADGRDDYDLYISKIGLDGKESWSLRQGEPDRDEVGWQVLRNRAGDYVILGTSSPKGGGASTIQVTFLSGDLTIRNQVSSPLSLPNSGLILHGASFYEMDGGGYLLGYAGLSYPALVRMDASGTVTSAEGLSMYATGNMRRATQFCKRPDGGFLLAALPSPGNVFGTAMMMMDGHGNQDSSVVIYLVGAYFSVMGICPRRSGGYVVSGYSDDGHAMLLLDSSMVNGVMVDRENEDWLGPVVELPSGNLLFGGHDHFSLDNYGNAPDDLHLQLCDSAGNDLRYVTYGGKATEAFAAMCPLPDGRVAILGETFSYGDGGSDLFLVFFQE